MINIIKRDIEKNKNNETKVPSNRTKQSESDTDSDRTIIIEYDKENSPMETSSGATAAPTPTAGTGNTFSQFLTVASSKKRKPTSPPPSKNRSKKTNSQPGTNTATTRGVPTSNRYEALTDNDDEGTDTENPQENINANTRKITPPPPLIIKGKVTNHNQFTNKIKTHVNKGFHIKYTLNNTNLYIHDTQERQTIINTLNNENIQYYTYTVKQAKTHAFVIRGLDSEPDVEDIQEELESAHKLKIINAYKLRTTRRPLYMVTTTTETKLKHLQNNVKYIAHTKIEWERHHNKKEIIQCHRCQQWGHATTNCHMDPLCVKCGANHWSRDCSKPRDTDAKCGGSHTANSIDCPVYTQKLDERHRQRDERQQQQKRLRTATTRYVPAPPPTRNAWTERAASRHAQQQPTTPELMTPTQSVVPPAISAVCLATTHARQPLLPLPQQCADVVATGARAPPPAKASDSVAQLQDLFQEMKTLKDNINLSSILLALRDLNHLLSNCKNKTEKFTTFLHFTDNINKYDI